MKWFIKIAVIVISIQVCPSILLGQTYFNMRYPPNQGTWGGWANSVVLSNNLYYFNKSSISYSNGNRNYSLTKIDVNGENIQVLDSVYYDSLEMGISGLKDNGNGFTEILTIYNNTLRTQHYGVVKYNSNGSIVSNIIDTSKYRTLHIKEFRVLNDHNLILVGEIKYDSSDNDNQRVLLLKTDSLGHEIWQKTYKFSPYMHLGESVSLCTDGGFIIGGADRNYATRNVMTRPLVIKVDSLGNVQWRRFYGSTVYQNEPVYGILQTQDSGYAFVGALGVNDSANIDQHIPWLVKLNATGGIEWERKSEESVTVSSPWENYFLDVVELNDGSLVAVGSQEVYYENKPTTAKSRIRGVISKYTKTGEFRWRRFYHHPEVQDIYQSENWLYAIEPTPDGGFAAVGTMAFSIDNTQDTWVLKVDSFGCLKKGCEVTSVPQINQPIAQLKIYPNPATEIVNIEITPAGNQQVFVFNLYDMLGKKVLTKKLHPYENKVNVSQLTSGIYTYKMGATWGEIVVE